ncbi:MAG: DNA adenine methylase [Pseudomonadota bacterium]|nr:DNA adenine methylase [Pseudomonadota bacterium]
MIKYLGSKRLLVPAILGVVAALQPGGTVIDLFSGTSRVGHALKRAGYRVLANDHNAYAHALATCYVAADAERYAAPAAALIAEFDALPGAPGYFTETFCERSRFFQPKNGARVDAIRDAIARKGLDPVLEAVLLVALMEAADRVDSTTGVQMAYLKAWAPRAHNDLALRLPDLLPRAPSGAGEASCRDAIDAVEHMSGDICYVDPPYNQHKYLGNYHVWETLTLWDRPEVYGTACKRVDVKTRGSAFNSKPGAAAALERVIRGAQARHLVVSFNDEGFLARRDIEAMLAHRGEIAVLTNDYKRYVGAQIGIHNPRGERVGAVSHVRNTELLYVVSPDPAAIARVRALAAEPAPRTATSGTSRPS